MRFEPDHEGWSAYIKFELRYSETARARGIYERYTQVNSTSIKDIKLFTEILSAGASRKEQGLEYVIYGS